MTFLGKLLVFLNILLATALLSWSVSLYTNRVDWPNVEVDGKKLTEWPAVYARDIAANNARYADAKDMVRAAEAQLSTRRVALRDQLALARSGQFYELERTGKIGQNLLERFDLTRDPARLTRVPKKDKTGDVLVPLRGYETLQKELQAAADATVGSEELGQESGKKGLAAIRRQLGVLDTEIAGLVTPFKDPQIPPPGTIARLTAAIAQREDEKRYLEDNRVNWDAQLITLQKRNTQLLERLKVFGVTAPAARGPVTVPPPTLTGSR